MVDLLAGLHRKRSRWPWWGQALYFVCIPYVALAAYGATKQDGQRRPWFIAAVVLFGVTAIAAGAGGASDDEETTIAAASQAAPTSEPAPNEVTTEVAPSTTSPSSTTTTAPPLTTTAPPVTTTSVPSVPGTLGMSAGEFETRWNTAAQQMGASDLRLAVDVESPDDAVQGTFTHFFTDYLSVLGSVNKSNGSVRDALLMAQPSSIDESATTLMAFGVLISTADPDATADDRRIVLEGLGFLEWDGGEHESETIHRNVRYTFSSSDMLGIWFTAGDPLDAE